MSITATNLTSNASTVDATSFTTASVSPAANALILVAVEVTSATTTPQITLAGNGLTYVQEQTTVAGARTVLMFRAMGAAPTTGTIVINGNGSTLTSCFWSVEQFTGVDTSGTNGSGAIVQSFNAILGSAASVSSSFPTAPKATNGAFAAVGIGVANSPTVGAGWTISSTAANLATPNGGFIAEHAVTAAPSAVLASWVTSAIPFVVGAELLRATIVGTPLTAGGVGGASLASTSFSHPAGLVANGTGHAFIGGTFILATTTAGYSVLTDNGVGYSTLTDSITGGDPLAADFSIKAHDRLPSIQTVLSSNGGVLDLTLATSVSFIMRPMAGGSPKVNSSATIVSAPAGLVRYDWLSIDTNTVGLYYGEFQVTWTGGKQQTFPTRKYHTIEVVQDLDGV